MTHFETEEQGNSEMAYRIQTAAVDLHIRSAGNE